MNSRNRFPVSWKVTLGVDKNGDNYRQLLRENGFSIGTWGEYVLARCNTSLETRTLALVDVAVEDLGFKDDTRYDVICAKALKFNLQRCPEEVGPVLRLLYRDQPMDEWLRIAMDPVVGPDGRYYIFGIERNDGGSWLVGDCGASEGFWRRNSRFIFCYTSGRR